MELKRLFFAVFMALVVMTASLVGDIIYLLFTHTSFTFEAFTFSLVVSLIGLYFYDKSKDIFKDEKNPILPGFEEQEGVAGKDYIPVEWVETLENYGKWKIVRADEDVVTLKEINKIPIYFKIPITTRYSADICEFNKDVTHIVEGKEFCEKDIYGNECRCWYVSTIFGASDDKEFLLEELAEVGYRPTHSDFNKGLFKDMSKN